MIGEIPDETIAIGVRHLDVLEVYKEALEDAFPERPIFVVSGKMSFANCKKLVLPSEAAKTVFCFALSRAYRQALTLSTLIKFSCLNFIITMLK